MPFFFPYLVGNEGWFLLKSLFKQSKIKRKIVGRVNGVVVLLDVGLDALVIQALNLFQSVTHGSKTSSQLANMGQLQLSSFIHKKYGSLGLVMLKDNAFRCRIWSLIVHWHSWKTYVQVTIEQSQLVRNAVDLGLEIVRLLRKVASQLFLDAGLAEYREDANG